VLVGLYTIHASQAATPYANVAASSGRLTGVATISSTTSSTGGNYVTFGTNPFTVSVSGPSSVLESDTANYNVSIVLIRLLVILLLILRYITAPISKSIKASKQINR